MLAYLTAALWATRGQQVGFIEWLGGHQANHLHLSRAITPTTFPSGAIAFLARPAAMATVHF